MVEKLRYAGQRQPKREDADAQATDVPVSKNSEEPGHWRDLTPHANIQHKQVPKESAGVMVFSAIRKGPIHDDFPTAAD